MNLYSQIALTTNSAFVAPSTIKKMEGPRENKRKKQEGGKKAFIPMGFSFDLGQPTGQDKQGGPISLGISTTV